MIADIFLSLFLIALAVEVEGHFCGQVIDIARLVAQQCARNDQGHVLCTLPVKAPSLVRSGDQVVKDLQADDPLSPVAHFHEFLSHMAVMGNDAVGPF